MAEIIKLCATDSDARFANAVCAIGVFDGVHKGHKYIIDCAKTDAAERGVKSAIITFLPDPDELFVPGFRKIMSGDVRVDALAKTNVDYVFVLNFDDKLSEMAPNDFLASVFFVGHPSAIHVGSDFRFGRGAKGTVEELNKWCAPRGVQVVAHDLLSLDGAPVKSTRIRKLLDEGNCEEAEKLLGHAL